MRNNDTELAWYAVKTVFKHLINQDSKTTTAYEERIVLLKTKDFSEALVLGEAEAREYSHLNSHVSYTGLY